MLCKSLIDVTQNVRFDNLPTFPRSITEPASQIAATAKRKFTTWSHGQRQQACFLRCSTAKSAEVGRTRSDSYVQWFGEEAPRIPGQSSPFSRPKDQLQAEKVTCMCRDLVPPYATSTLGFSLGLLACLHSKAWRLEDLGQLSG